MEDNKSNNSNTTETESPSGIDEFIRKLDIDLAQFEKVGVILIMIGYSNFFIGADLDIVAALDESYGELLPDEITLFGQQLVFYGYTCLWIVAYNRLKEKNFRHENIEEQYLIPAYEEIANAYFLSVIANGLRVQAFYKISQFLRNNPPFN